MYNLENHRFLWRDSEGGGRHMFWVVVWQHDAVSLQIDRAADRRARKINGDGSWERDTASPVDPCIDRLEEWWNLFSTGNELYKGNVVE